MIESMALGYEDRFIPCPKLATLMWDGDELVDVTSGTRIREDGSVAQARHSLADRFDRAIGLRHGNTFWSVVYTNRHTKALLLKDEQIHRELDRSFYFAHAYDYPITLTVGASGEVVLIHCPEQFDTLEFEHAETGDKIAKRKIREMEFHSRLAVSPDGRYLLDAGWFWHPVGGAWLGEVATFLAPNAPDSFGHSFFDSGGAEIDSAAFRGESHVVVTSTDEEIDEAATCGLAARQMGLWSIGASAWESRVDLAQISGTIMPWRDWVISFDQCPKAIELKTGNVVHQWKNVYSGKQVGSIDLGDPPPPVMALDASRGRFAVQVPDGLLVVSLNG